MFRYEMEEDKLEKCIEETHLLSLDSDEETEVPDHDTESIEDGSSTTTSSGSYRTVFGCDSIKSVQEGIPDVSMVIHELTDDDMMILIQARLKYLLVVQESKMCDVDVQTFATQLIKEKVHGCVNCGKDDHKLQSCPNELKSGFCHVCGAIGFDSADCVFPHLLDKGQMMTVAKLDRFFRYQHGSGAYDLPYTAEYIRRYLKIKNANRRETIKMAVSGKSKDEAVKMSVVRILHICDSEESAEEYRRRYKHKRLAFKPPGYTPAHIMQRKMAESTKRKRRTAAALIKKSDKRSATAAALEGLGEKSTEPSKKVRKQEHESSTGAKTEGKSKGRKLKASVLDDRELSVLGEICARLKDEPETTDDATQTPKKCTSTDDNVPTNGNASAIVDKISDMTNAIQEALLVFDADVGSTDWKRLMGNGIYLGDVESNLQRIHGEGPEVSNTVLIDVLTDTPQNDVKLPETSHSGKKSGTSENDAAVGSPEEVSNIVLIDVLTDKPQNNVRTADNWALSINRNTENTYDGDGPDDETSLNGETNTSEKSVDDRHSANSSRATSKVFSDDWPQKIQVSSCCTSNNTVRIRSDKLLPGQSNIVVKTTPYNVKGNNGSNNSSYDSTPQQQQTNVARKRLFNKRQEKQEPPKTLQKKQSEPTNPPKASPEAGISLTPGEEQILKMIYKLLRKFDEMQSWMMDLELKVMNRGPNTAAAEQAVLEEIPPPDEHNKITMNGVRFDRRLYVTAALSTNMSARISALIDARWEREERVQLRVSSRAGNDHLTTIPPEELQRLLECCAGLQLRKCLVGGDLEDLQRNNLFRSSVSGKLASDRGYDTKKIKGYIPPKNNGPSKKSKKRTKVARNTTSGSEDHDDVNQKKAKVLCNVQVHKNQRQCEENETSEST